MTVIPKRIRVMAAKVETTIGTDASISASDGAFNAYDVMIQPTIDTEARESQGSFDYLSAVPGARMGTATFKTDLGWDGSATVPTWASVLLPGCGWVNSSGVFNAVSEAPGSNAKTLTIACYMGGKLKKIVGAMGAFRMVLPTARMGYIEWTFQGVWVAPTDTALITPTYPTAAPIRANGSLTYGGDALKVENVTVDSGNEVVLREDTAVDAGYCNAIVVNRHSTITANPEADLVANRDVYGDWVARTEAAFTYTLDGPADSTLAISAPKAQIVSAAEGDRNRIVIDEIEWHCQKNGTAANQALTFTFTEAT